jgi:hypothetical protein
MSSTVCILENFAGRLAPVRPSAEVNLIQELLIQAIALPTASPTITRDDVRRFPPGLRINMPVTLTFKRWGGW